jgi:nucleotide-binding universal stress UspA family protein
MKDRTPTRILVAIDFSPASRRALRYSIDLAAQSSAQLDLVHVMTPPIPVTAGPEPLAMAAVAVDERPRVLQELETWCAVGRENGVPSSCHLIEGEPASSILECAEEIGADHIVLGAHGHSRLHELFLGSVARDVQSRALCPVTTLRALEEPVA